MDFFKPGSTLKREDPKAHTYERNRARDAYKKQLEIFKIRFEHELAAHPKLDFDAKQEIRIKAKGLRERCLATYRENLQGLATTNHRRNYKDLFLGNRDIAIQMHDTTILDYELRLSHEMDTIISHLGLMKEDKSNRETLDWMANLARQKFSYELFNPTEHPAEVDIKLQLEREEEPEPIYPYEEEMAGPICSSRLSPPKYKSSFMREMMRQKNEARSFEVDDVNGGGDYGNGLGNSYAYDDFESIYPRGGPSSRSVSRGPSLAPPLPERPRHHRRFRDDVEEEEQTDQLKDETFNREFNLITQSPRLVRSQYEPEVDEDEERWRIRASPARSYMSSTTADHTDRDYCYRDTSRSVSRQPASTSTSVPNGTRRAAPVDVDDDDDVEAFLAKSRAMINRSKNRAPIRFDDDDEDD